MPTLQALFYYYCIIDSYRSLRLGVQNLLSATVALDQDVGTLCKIWRG